MKKGEKRKQELLKIAYQLFIEKGYENTSVDEIIATAGIAKGTYYYYFPSKEATLEAVIELMIHEEVQRAKEVLQSSLPVSQKFIAVIAAFRPTENEAGIAKTIDATENLLMHNRVNQRITKEAIPFLIEVTKEGIEKKVFDCNHIEERVKMLLILGQQAFDEGKYTHKDVEVYIDIAEKTLGAKRGTMKFIGDIIANRKKA